MGERPYHSIALLTQLDLAGVLQSAAGLLTGDFTTAALAVRALGRRVAAGLDICRVPTSEKTAALARELGVPLWDLAQHERIDLTIDGAYEVERGTLHLVKGLGGAAAAIRNLNQ